MIFFFFSFWFCFPSVITGFPLSVKDNDQLPSKSDKPLVENSLAPFDNPMKINGATSHCCAFEKLYERERAENKLLIAVNTKLKGQLDDYSAAQLKLLYRQAIEEVEDDFPQEYEQDYHKNKVQWNKTILATKTGFDLREEKRRQKWVWYAKHPLNQRMKKIVKHAKERGLTEEEFGSGVAKAHRRLSSEDIHDGEALVKQILDPVKFYRARTVVQSLRVVLEDADIMKQYKPNFPNE